MTDGCRIMCPCNDQNVPGWCTRELGRCEIKAALGESYGFYEGLAGPETSASPTGAMPAEDFSKTGGSGSGSDSDAAAIRRRRLERERGEAKAAARPLQPPSCPPTLCDVTCAGPS